MKPKSSLLHFLALAGSSLLAVSSASAQTGTWNVDANGLWGTDTNWASNTIADGAANTANFTNNITADRTVSLDTDRTINRVNFADSITATAGSWILDNNGTSTNNLILSGTTGAATGTVPVISVATLGTGKTATISAVIEGSYGFTKAGAGRLVLSGDNTYTGVTTHGSSNGITIVASDNALGSTAVGSHTEITLSNADNLYIGINNGVNTPENFTISGSSNSGATAIRGMSGTATLSGTITLAGTGQIRLGGTIGGTALNWAGTITRSSTNNNGLVFYGNNTVSNAITINGGSLTAVSGTVTLNGVNPTDGTGLGSAGTFGGNFTLGVTNALRTDGDFSFAGGASRLDLNGNNQTIKGLISSSSTGYEVHNNNNATTSTLTVGNGGGDHSFGGVIRNNTNSGTGVVALVKTGAGNQTLTGINTFTGGTRIDNGTLTLGNATNTLANTGAVNVNGGTLALGANNDTVGAVTLTSGNITGSGGTLTGSSYDVRSGSVSAILGGSGGLTKSTAGTVTLTGDNSYTGATNVDAGTLVLSGTGDINQTSAINVAGGATFAYNSSTALTVAPTLNGTPGNKATFSGSGNLGTVAFTYNSLDDVISPGNSPGIQAYGSNQQWSSYTYAWELNDWANDVGGTDFDLITVAGQLDLNGTAYALDILSLTSGNVSGSVGAGGGNTFTDTNNSWTILTTTGGILNFNPLEWNINAAGFLDAENPAGWSLSVVNGGNDLLLTYTAIPEPGAALLGCLGLMLMFRRRR